MRTGTFSFCGMTVRIYDGIPSVDGGFIADTPYFDCTGYDVTYYDDDYEGFSEAVYDYLDHGLFRAPGYFEIRECYSILVNLDRICEIESDEYDTESAMLAAIDSPGKP